MENEKIWELVQELKRNVGAFQLSSDGLEILNEFNLSEDDFFNVALEPLDIPIPGEGIWG